MAEEKGKDSDDKEKQAQSGNGSTAQPEGAEDDGKDAIALLKADHRTVEALFDRYKKATKSSEKSELAHEICKELVIHATIEEEIFYPACRGNAEEEKLDEAQVEHDGAKILIADLLAGSPGDNFYDAKVSVLAEQIRHHVREEEKRSEGIFAQAKAAGLDLDDLARRLRERKSELQTMVQQWGVPPPQPASFTRQPSQKENAMAYQRMPDRDERGRFMSDDDDYGYSRRGRGQGSRYEDDDYRGSSRRSRDYDDDYRGGYHGYSRGRDRDEYGRFTSEDERGYGRSSARDRDYDNDYRGSGRYYSQNRDRDEYGRFASEDDRGYGRSGYRGRGYDDDYGRGSRRSSQYDRPRDEYGRFTSDDDDDRHSTRSRSYNRYRDDDDYESRGQGGWFGDPEGHSRAARKGWRNR